MTQSTQMKPLDSHHFAAYRLFDGFDTAVAIVAQCHLGKQVIDCNQAFEFLTGYPRSAIIGQRWHQFQRITAKFTTPKAMAKALASGQVLQCKARVFHRSKGSRWCVLSIMPLSFSPKTYCVEYQIIPPQHRSVHFQLPRPLAYPAIFEALGCAVIIQNVEGNIIAANKAAECLFGDKHNTLYGRNLYHQPWPLIDQRGQPFAPRDCPGARLLNAVESIDNCLVGVVDQHKNRRWLLSSVRPLLTALKTSPVGLVSIFTDITLQQENIDALRYYRLLLESYREPTAFIDNNFYYRIVNQALLNHLGLTREAVEHHLVEEVWGNEFFEQHWQAALKSSLAGHSHYQQVHIAFPAWGKRYCQLYCDPCLNEQQQIVGVVMVLHAIDAVASTDSQCQLNIDFFEHSNEGVIIFDAEHRIVAVNAAFCRHTGYQHSEVIGELPDVLLSALANVEVYDEIWRVLSYESSWEGDVGYRRRDGRLLPTWQRISRVSDQRGYVHHYIAMFSDLSRLQAYQLELQRLASYDLLTGLPNRSLLSDRLFQAIARAKQSHHQVALLFIDIDRFRLINDSLGSNYGDELLKIVANRLTARLHSTDTLCRYGADQFLVLMPNIHSPDQAASLAIQLLNAISPLCVIGGQEVALTAGIGISVYPEDGDQPNELIQHADTAMGYAKRNGRNTFQFFTHDMNQRTAEYLLLEGHLRHGLAHHEFLLYYQPQINLKSRQIIGFEALVRWRHPEMGFVQPNRFIPVAEESGLITPLGAWVIHEACQQIRHWQLTNTVTLPVAVNVAAPQFSSNIAEVVAESLAAAQLPAELLQLEVTESILMEDIDIAINTLNKLKQMGIRIAIDDFGTGYSSLAYLKRLPLDKIKIDRSFVIDILDDADDAAIAEAIISLAKHLRLKVIAEGVEQMAQLDLLEKLGCDEVQGYLISPPLAYEDVANFVKNWQSKR